MTGNGEPGLVVSGARVVSPGRDWGVVPVRIEKVRIAAAAMTDAIVRLLPGVLGGSAASRRRCTRRFCVSSTRESSSLTNLDIE